MSATQVERRGTVAVVTLANPPVKGFGADIREFGRTPPPGVPNLTELIDRLEASGKPVVAAIHGVAAGAGLERALGCHHRTAAPKTRLGPPEVTLDLIVSAMRRFRAEHGDWMTPAPLQEKLAAD